MIAVIGISTSSQALVNQKLSALGTNLLTASAGKDLFNNGTKLPVDSAEHIRRIDGVENASWTALIQKRAIYRNSSIDPGSTGGLSVVTADLDLLATTSTTVAAGQWLNETTARFPAVVLGSKAAERLGIVSIGSQVWLGGTQFTVVGILDPSALAPELDQTAIVGPAIATELFGFDGAPTTIYEVSAEGTVEQVRALLPPTIRPDAPNEVTVSRPSDALAAKNTVDQAFTGLLVGVGSIALLVGGIGVANTMVISVLERRREIGMRRSLGATRSHVRTQFLVEAMMLAAYGGVAGTVLGWLITAAVAQGNGWLLSIPPIVLVAGVTVTVVVGAIAGVLPAIRAAKTSPTAALAS